MANQTLVLNPENDDLVNSSTAPYVNRGYFGDLAGQNDSYLEPVAVAQTTSDRAVSTSAVPVLVTSVNPVIGERPSDYPSDNQIATGADNDSMIDATSKNDVGKGATLGAVGGAAVGALAGGPIGAIIGAIAGGAASAAAVAGVDMVDNDDSKGEIPTKVAGETPGEYTDRIITLRDREEVFDTV